MISLEEVAARVLFGLFWLMALLTPLYYLLPKQPEPPFSFNPTVRTTTQTFYRDGSRRQRVERLNADGIWIADGEWEELRPSEFYKWRAEMLGAREEKP